MDQLSYVDLGVSKPRLIILLIEYFAFSADEIFVAKQTLFYQDRYPLPTLPRVRPLYNKNHVDATRW